MGCLNIFLGTIICTNHSLKCLTLSRNSKPCCGIHKSIYTKKIAKHPVIIDINMINVFEKYDMIKSIHLITYKLCLCTNVNKAFFVSLKSSATVSAFWNDKILTLYTHKNCHGNSRQFMTVTKIVQNIHIFDHVYF